MISYFCLFALFLPYCFSFPLDHYSQFHRTQQQSACQSLVLDTQRNVINTKEFMPLNVTNTWYENPIEFQFSKPSIDSENKLLHVQSCIIPQWNDPCVLYIKMVGQPLFLKEYPDVKVGKPISAKEVNKRLLQDRISKKTNVDFSVTCMPDVIFGEKPTAGFKWFKEKISTEYDERDKRLFIRSPSLITDIDIPIKKYAGLHYMKLLTPEFADYLIEKYGTSIF